jgi:hypothetical protein
MHFCEGKAELFPLGENELVFSTVLNVLYVNKFALFNSHIIRSVMLVWKPEGHGFDSR